MNVLAIYDWLHRWFLAPGHSWRTWLGHGFVVLIITWVGFVAFDSHYPGVTIIGFYFWRELLEQILPRALAGRTVDVIDSWFDVFVPWVLFVASLAIWERIAG